VYYQVAASFGIVFVLQPLSIAALSGHVGLQNAKTNSPVVVSNRYKPCVQSAQSSQHDTHPGLLFA